METTIQDVFLGKTNDSTPRATSLTRGIVAAALVGVINSVLIFIPLDPEQKVAFLAALNPVIIFLSYILYGLMDHITKHGNNN